jgi:hypothetical protein
LSLKLPQAAEQAAAPHHEAALPSRHDHACRLRVTSRLYAKSGRIIRRIRLADEWLLLLLFVPPALQVDFMIDETMPRMVAWGLLQQHGQQQYSLVPLPQALHNLTAYWQRMQQPAAAEDSTGGEAAAGQRKYSLQAGPHAAATAAVGAAGRMLVGCEGFAATQHCHGGGSGFGGRVLAWRMPAPQLQRRCVVPRRLARGAGCAAAAAAGRVQARQGLAAAGRAGMRA